MPGPSIVDIHVHPDLKSFLSSNEEMNRTSCWQYLCNDPLIRAIDTLFLGNILESQSNLEQLNNVKGTIAIVGLTVVEKAMIKADLINLILFHINLLRVSKILEITHAENILDYELLKRTSRLRSRYFSVFDEMLSHLLLSKLIAPGFNLLDRISQYDPQNLNVILTAEGGHNLYKRNCGLRFRKGVIGSLSSLKSGRFRFLFIGLAHHSRNALCTHAWSMKILHHRKFKPVGRGITRLGRRVITDSLKDLNRPILIDIKHMSLESRKQYYEMLSRDAVLAGRKIPVITSHTGVTGISYQERGRFVESCRRCCRWTKVLWKQPSGLLNTKFNPWSINLYDEEIIKIVESDGLIGLSLDARVLGARQEEKKDRIEYFSRKELRCSDLEYSRVDQIRSPHQVAPPTPELLPFTPEESAVISLERKIRERLVRYMKRVNKQPRRYKDFQYERNGILADFTELQSMKKQLNSSNLSHTDDIRYLCNNILHIVKVAGPEAWEHICIGSDFDGLVSSIECCRDVTGYDNLAQKLIQELPLMAAASPALAGIANINQKVDDIMSGNAYRFLQKYFT